MFLAILFATAQARGEWTVDFSRRQAAARAPASELSAPLKVDDRIATPPAADPAPLAGPAPKAGEVAQEIVVLNTPTGFVPSLLPVRRGLTYKISVVNVNESERNVSFVLDSFNESHGTYYGKITSFLIRPEREGIYKYVSPETSAEGKLVVMPSPERTPASAD